MALDQYLPLFSMLALVFLFAALSFLASVLLGPKRPTAAKEAPYECGIVPEIEPAERFPVKFYLVAMAFIVLDVEIIFLYPFTTVLKGSRRLRARDHGRVLARRAGAVRLPPLHRRGRLGSGAPGGGAGGYAGAPRRRAPGRDGLDPNAPRPEPRKRL